MTGPPLNDIIPAGMSGPAGPTTTPSPFARDPPRVGPEGSGRGPAPRPLGARAPSAYPTAPSSAELAWHNIAASTTDGRPIRVTVTKNARRAGPTMAPREDPLWPLLARGRASLYAPSLPRPRAARGRAVAVGARMASELAKGEEPRKA